MNWEELDETVETHAEAMVGRILGCPEAVVYMAAHHVTTTDIKDVGKDLVYYLNKKRLERSEDV